MTAKRHVFQDSSLQCSFSFSPPGALYSQIHTGCFLWHIISFLLPTCCFSFALIKWRGGPFGSWFEGMQSITVAMAWQECTAGTPLSCTDHETEVSAVLNWPLKNVQILFIKLPPPRAVQSKNIVTVTAQPIGADG